MRYMGAYPEVGAHLGYYGITEKLGVACVDEARSGIDIGLVCSPAVWRLLLGQ